ncbi:MAG TPA: PAS domain-containing protein [Stellaceae bacterium]|nr:PAS domain-containing protein [Stellaceae bacterium]
MALSATAEAAAPPYIAELSADVLDAIDDGFCAIDRDWRIVHINRRACALCGIARSRS